MNKNTKIILVISAIGVLSLIALNILKTIEVDKNASLGTPLAKAQVGTIEGSLSYPSETLPLNLTVCAKKIDNGELFCTKDHIQAESGVYTYGVGYKIIVPTGKYEVYAYVPGNESQKAYYSDFVVCGLNASCPSHKPITVAVKDGETTKEVDPQDWYSQQ